MSAAKLTTLLCGKKGSAFTAKQAKKSNSAVNE
jgi:hypothetical protein